jgi:PEP-CTERM motif
MVTLCKSKGDIMRKIVVVACLAVTALFAAAPASAAQIRYTLSGTGAGSINGTVFSGAFTATAVGDTATDFNPDPAITSFLTQPLQISIGANRFISTLPVFVFTNNAVAAGGFVQLNPGGVGTGVHSVTFNRAAAFATYRGDADIGPLPVTFEIFPPQFQFLDTDLGRLTWVPGSFQNVTFSAISLASGVPEPGSWAMMMFGMALTGAGLRRRNQIRLTYA